MLGPAPCSPVLGGSRQSERLTTATVLLGSRTYVTYQGHFQYIHVYLYIAHVIQWKNKSEKLLRFKTLFVYVILSSILIAWDSVIS